MVHKVDENTLVVKHRTDSLLHFKIRVIYHDNGEIEWIGLPQSLIIDDKLFSYNDMRFYPDLCIERLLRLEYERAYDLRPFEEI